jgi:hypothetical protein
MQMSGQFNANQFEPKQSGGGHPVGNKFPFTITSTEIKENAAKDGGYFCVEFTSPVGSIKHNYNIWNKTPKAVEIAHGQLSALCRATGIYQINWENEGAALRGGKGLMDVGHQKGEEPTAEKPEGGYVELKRVYDMAGNEPGKPPTQNQPQTGQAQPMTQQAGGGWGNQQPQTNPSPGPSQDAGKAWQPGGAGPAANPPWGSRT